MTDFANRIASQVERSHLAKAGWAALAALALIAPASAQQRDPAYAAARSSGSVGEKVDGYLGYPAAPSAEVRRLADDINIKRKAVYSERAQANGVTIEEYAFTAGCQAISRTAAGEKYQSPDGRSWLTRGTGEPQRDPRCP